MKTGAIVQNSDVNVDNLGVRESVAEGVGAPSDDDIDVSIVVPAFNEGRRLPHSLPPLLAALDELDSRCEIVLVDDGSVDDTLAVAARHLVDRPDVQLLQLPWNCGKGAAVRAGVNAANGTHVVFLDADLASDMADLPRLLSLLEHADIALGSRTLPSSLVQGRSTARNVGGAVYSRLVHKLTAAEVADTQCGFKAFRAPAAKLLFSMTASNGFGFDVEILTLARALGFRIVECPIRWTAIDGGHVSLRRHGLGMLNDLRRARVHQHRALTEAGHGSSQRTESWQPEVVSGFGRRGPCVIYLDPPSGETMSVGLEELALD
jgi:dolichyl-phosphate beta-glucosyltransferase